MMVLVRRTVPTALQPRQWMSCCIPDAAYSYLCMMGVASSQLQLQLKIPA